MSWSKILTSQAFVLLMVLMVGCVANTPNQTPQLGQIAISIDNSREAQLYRQKLGRLLARYGAEQAQYTLETQLNFNEENDFLTMTADLSLYARGSGQVLVTKRLESSASIGAVSSLYSTDEGRRHARIRLAENLAARTHHYLLLFFIRQQSP